MEKATLSKGAVASGGGAPYNDGDYYADDSARYAPPHSYSQGRHGVKV